MARLVTRKLITDHLPLIRSIAGRLLRVCRVPVEFDELISAGVLGLADAARRFDRLTGNRFITFAYHRIRGAMLDTIAAAAPVHRSMYRCGKTRHVSIEAFASAGGQLANTDEPEIEDALDRLRAQRRLESAVIALTERQRHLIARHYVEGDNLQNIGVQLGVSKSWASRLHARTLAELREAMAA